MLPVDIPAGPFGYTTGIPWFGDDAKAASFNQQMVKKSLQKMRDYGFTACSGLPSIAYQGFDQGKPVLDFTSADAVDEDAQVAWLPGCEQLRRRRLGIRRLSSRCCRDGLGGFDGLCELSSRRVYSQVERHAVERDWIPVYYNLADEPIGDELVRSAENAEAYRRAFPKGPPYFTGASSFTGSDREDPHFRLAKALNVVSWNDHDEQSVNLLHGLGADWAFYNGGNRWTYGTYMYKAAKQFGMKFRLSWHWNVVAGDPYYALDCREDDYAWCNTSPEGELIPSVELERLREGLDDYRRLITLAKLAERGRPHARRAVRQRPDCESYVGVQTRPARSRCAVSAGRLGSFSASGR